MLTNYFLDLALVDASFSCLRSSLKCAAAVSLSLNVVGTMSVQQCWALGLELISHTDLKPAELEACMCRMSRMLLRATEATDSQVGENCIQSLFRRLSILDCWFIHIVDMIHVYMHDFIACLALQNCIISKIIIMFTVILMTSISCELCIKKLCTSAQSPVTRPPLRQLAVDDRNYASFLLYPADLHKLVFSVLI